MPEHHRQVQGVAERLRAGTVAAIRSNPARLAAPLGGQQRHSRGAGGHDLFDWLARHRLAVRAPTVETRLVDGDGVRATVLEIPFEPPVSRPW